MFYVLVNDDGTVARYPYTFTDLKLAHPGVSFPTTIDDTTAAGFNVFPVTPTAQPAEDYRINLTRIAVKQGSNWVEEWISAPATPEEISQRTAYQADAVRSDRNRRLFDSDWTQLADTPLSIEAKEAWAFYRENLRMVPQQAGFPWNVTWPPEPQS